MNTMGLKKMMVVLVLVGVLAGFVQADKLELQDKLGKEVPVELKDVTISEALERIGEETEMEIVLSDEAAWKLPQGAATRLNVVLKGPLAESLTELLNTFFMRYAVGEEQITIYPRPELEHILGRPTAEQLELLTKIYNTTITVSKEVSSKAIVSKFVGQGVLVLPVEYYTELDKFLRTLTSGVPEGERSPAFTMAHMLDSVGGAWYLSGMDFPDQIPEIRVVTEEEFRRVKLDQIVDISMEDRATAIIQRLANWTGMELVLDRRDPDWLAGDAIIGVSVQNTKLGQALRNVVGMANGGISIDIQRNYIQIVGPIHEKKRPSAARPAATPRRPEEGGKITRASGDYVGKISIPMDDGKYFIEFMLQESDLTEELRKLRDEKMEQILGRPPKPRPAVTPSRPGTKRRAGMSPSAWAAAHAESRVTATRFSLKMLHTAVTEFKMDTGRYPTEEEGLMALIEQPSDVAGYSKGGYIKNKEMLKDAWGREFIYQLWYEDRPFVIFSYGADGKEGGQGEDADLWSTKL